MTFQTTLFEATIASEGIQQQARLEWCGEQARLERCGEQARLEWCGELCGLEGSLNELRRSICLSTETSPNIYRNIFYISDDTLRFMWI